MDLEKKLYTLNELLLTDKPELWHNYPTLNGVNEKMVSLEVLEIRKPEAGVTTSTEYFYIQDERKVPVFKIERSDVLDEKLNLVEVVEKQYYGYHTSAMPIGEYEYDLFTTVNKKYMKIDVNGDKDWSSALQELEQRRKNIKTHIEKECANMFLPNGFCIGNMLMNDIFIYYAGIMNVWIQTGYIDGFYSKLDSNIQDFINSGKTVEEVIGNRVSQTIAGTQGTVSGVELGAYLVSPSLREGFNVNDWLRQYIYEYQIKM